MSDEAEITKAFVSMKDQLSILAFSGVAGALFRAVLAPEEKWKRRVVQGATGALSAIFLGGVVGHMIDEFTGSGITSYLAAGFLMGSGGEVAVKALQDRFMVKK